MRRHRIRLSGGVVLRCQRWRRRRPLFRGLAPLITAAAAIAAAGAICVGMACKRRHNLALGAGDDRSCLRLRLRLRLRLCGLRLR